MFFLSKKFIAWFSLGWTGRLYQRYMFGEKKDCTPIANALHSCMFWLQRKDVQELVRVSSKSDWNEVNFLFNRKT